MQINQQAVFTFVRHAKSQYNQSIQQLIQSLPQHISFRQTPQYQQIKLKQDLMDCSISKYGISQCLQLKEKIDQNQYDLVVVSPLRRALQTCDQIFKNHEVKIIVEPILCEKIAAACDIGSNLQKSMNDFSYMDFSKVHKNSKGWYLNLLSNQQKEKVLKQHQKVKNIDKATLNIIAITGTLETNENLKERVQKAKIQLMKYKKMSKKKVFVISHGGLIKQLIAQELNQKGDLIESQNIHNCQLIEKSIIVPKLQSQKTQVQMILKQQSSQKQIIKHSQ